MQTEQTAPDDTCDDDLSLEVEQWERDNAAVRAELLRRRQAEIEDRRQFGKPIAMLDMQRIMSLWVEYSLAASAAYEKAPPVPRVSRVSGSLESRA